MKRKVFEALSVFFVFLTLYLLLLPQVISLSHDSIGYIVSIIRDEAVFHPHHLLTHKFVYYWYAAVSYLFPDIDKITAICSINAFFGAGGISLVYLLTKYKFNLSYFTSIITVLLSGLSFGYFFYSMALEVYIIPLFFILLSFYFLLSIEKNTKYIYPLAVSSALAVLFHQVHVLFAGVIFSYLVYLIIKKSSIKVKHLAYFSIISAAVIGLPYLSVIFLVESRTSINEAIYWLTYYNHVGNYWTPFGLKFFIYPFIGYSRSIFSAEALFTIDAVRDYITKSFPANNLNDEIYLVRNISSSAILIISLYLTAFLSYLTLLLNNIKDIIKKQTVKTKLFIPFYIFLAVYSVFFTFWDSQNLEFWIAQSVIIWLVFAQGIERNKHKITVKTASILLPVLMLILNLFYCILPAQDLINDFNYKQVKEFEASINNDVKVFVVNPWIVSDYLKLYSNIEFSELFENMNSNAKEVFVTKLENILLKNKVLLDADSIKIITPASTKIYSKDVLLEIPVPVSFEEKMFFKKKWYILNKTSSL